MVVASSTYGYCYCCVVYLVCVLSCMLYICEHILVFTNCLCILYCVYVILLIVCLVSFDVVKGGEV